MNLKQHSINHVAQVTYLSRCYDGHGFFNDDFLPEPFEDSVSPVKLYGPRPRLEPLRGDHLVLDCVLYRCVDLCDPLALIWKGAVEIQREIIPS